MKSLPRTVLLLVVAGLFPLAHCYCQNEQKTSDTLRSLAPKVYIDCMECSRSDEDHFRTELTLVNFVRDRKQADIHILITTQGTGGGGDEITIEFIGQHEYENMVDTLKFFTKESDTEDMIRSAAVRTLKMGLMRYVAKTPLAEHVAIEYTQPSEPAAVVDKWNYWVFEIEANIWLNGEKSRRYVSFWGNISARRVTKQSKIDFSIWGDYNESKFDYEDYKALSISRSKGAEASFIWSLSDHWSAGLSSEVYSSTYSNKKIGLWCAPGIEYNLFPYDQSTRRQLRFTYRLSTTYVDYEEETIYDKTSEWLPAERLSVSLDLIQSWGSVYTSLTGSHYFHDFDRNRLQLYSQLSIRLFEGFSFDIDGSISRIHDQLSLPKGEATEEEVLLQRRELATSYNYWASVGVSYTFGSIYNNIVNPRFGN